MTKGRVRRRWASWWDRITHSCRRESRNGRTVFGELPAPSGDKTGWQQTAGPTSRSRIEGCRCGRRRLWFGNIPTAWFTGDREDGLNPLHTLE